MNKKFNHYQLAFLRVLTLVLFLTVSFIIVSDTLAAEPEENKPIVRQILEILFGNVADVTPTPIDKPTCRPMANSGGNTGAEDVYKDFSGTVDTSFSYADYGLPQPQLDGTESLFKSIGSNTNMAFWARRLLNSEKVTLLPKSS